jgi:hypothetical protein
MDKAKLFVDLSEPEEVTISTGVVTVRGLSRYEIMLCANPDLPNLVKEQKQLNLAMLDPEMSEGDVDRWQKTPGAFRDIQTVVEAVNRLSAVGKDAQKAAYKSDGGGPDAGIRDIPSEEADTNGG